MTASNNSQPGTQLRSCVEYDESSRSIVPVFALSDIRFLSVVSLLSPTQMKRRFTFA